MRIALIGAGSWVFTRTLCNDVFLTPALRDATIALMDIDAGALERARDAVLDVAAQRGVDAHLEATLDRREAIRGADAVVTTFQQGGLDAYRHDIDIPARYGVLQCVGDTLGPGGVFRGLRTIPVLLDLCRDMDELAPDALLLNYVNPMSINCWAIERATGRPTLGLCHSVQGTSEMLASWLGVPYPEVDFVCAGINHQAFFLTFRHGRENLYPALREAVQRPELDALEPVRIELFRRFGYFVTESSGHASEYVPYFRRTPDLVDELVPRFRDPANDWYGRGRTRGNLDYVLTRDERPPRPASAERSHEYGAAILEAVQANRPAVVHANVPNDGLIDNLPPGCCVEVACVVDGGGARPVRLGSLPSQLAALNRCCVNVQELAVEAALTGSVEAVHQSVLLDPLTAASATPDAIHRMVEELLQAEAPWLPQFARL